MFASSRLHVYIFRLAYFALIAAVSVTLFSSWGAAPSKLTFAHAAGASALKTTVSAHTIKLGGNQLNYTSTAGYLQVADGRFGANIFYTAYKVNDGQPNRPVTFVFNGGPGSSSIWLHMGAFGPVRSTPGKAGYQTNPDSWLGFTDLVFIDPVGTGYSRPADGTDARRFYGYHEDVRIIGNFISRYLAYNNRQQRPVFLTGESYGGARAVGLASYLADEQHVEVAGLTLISPALNYRLISFKDKNTAAYPLYLPSYALAAQYHQRLIAEWQALPGSELYRIAENFSTTTYSRFLASGDTITQTITDTLRLLTGLPEHTIRGLNGRIPDHVFTRLVLNNNRVGIFDARTSGANNKADPSSARLRAVFPQAFKTYVEDELKYRNALPYLATTATPNWNYGPAAEGSYLNVLPTLTTLLYKHKALKVNIVSGYYDLATPVATINASVKQLLANQAFKTRVNAHYYQSGHMPYIDDEVNHQFSADSRGFYAATLN
ncbi:alpha/beta hydrolase [Mucilaginibacter roseus]|uniref:Alpha/beta hydrolase n=1 Tax=Mucilaginibacter roseus TaxID=1528868 RepID=A0ABS8TZE3_9SPHI|nr:alpha/beta hydrolase [Mucilaginibacter roseus]MCD8740248.1 alpha/beta hydrolase [Mucilaginibacter roseus]